MIVKDSQELKVDIKTPSPEYLLQKCRMHPSKCQKLKLILSHISSRPCVCQLDNSQLQYVMQLFKLVICINVPTGYNGTQLRFSRALTIFFPLCGMSS